MFKVVAFLSGSLIGSYLVSKSIIDLQKNYYTRRSIDADAWNKLPMSAVIKSSDTDLKLYSQKKLEYELIIRDLLEYKKAQNAHGLLQTLYRLRHHPLYDENCNNEYSALVNLLLSEINLKKNLMKPFIN